MLVGSHERGGLYLNSDLRVPHGCKNSDGSRTTGITVEIPSEILAVQAEYIPGFNMTITKQQLSEPQSLSEGGRQVTERIASVQWTSSEPIPSGAFMDFKLRLFIPEIHDDDTHIHWFKTVQHCENNVNDIYDQIPDSANYNESAGRNAPFIEIGTENDPHPWVESKENRNDISGASNIQNAFAGATVIIAGLAAINLA
ncbi:hypothetical protein BDA99DRAFT_565203 [Phascolomyces articulosus]|uniref:YncI copper-binding domain-containing protein n=1 Tax=Phascolomyces articulosus TaxID=60185 RepID=A0AAD5JNH6_9FUNG|nr:hypothetical protein BDA99DRAFT_565203 [Phascolomyces articulosus]